MTSECRFVDKIPEDNPRMIVGASASGSDVGLSEVDGLRDERGIGVKEEREKDEVGAEDIRVDDPSKREPEPKIERRVDDNFGVVETEGSELCRFRGGIEDEDGADKSEALVVEVENEVERVVGEGEDDCKN